MIFTSFEFLLFFAAVVLLRGYIRNFVLEKWFLLAASYCFYMSWSIPLILVILVPSVVDYRIGRILEVTDNDSLRRRLLRLSLLTNLSILGVFKYANFFLDNIRFGLSAFGLPAHNFQVDVSLPPGISFFTFASISYVVDVYYEKTRPCRSALDYALFLAYFPKLLAGPVARATSFLPQLQARARATWDDVECGLAYILVGAVKKLVISDQVAGHVNLIWSSPDRFDGLTLFQALLGYAIQIYCDFSGYSDMAIGSARLMGFRLPNNFQFPYSASSISEFWRRWHISLSDWFRDYVFLPLELGTRANRNAALRVSINLMVTMLLCGLWHGAGWNFVVWGGIHGAALAIHTMWTSWRLVEGMKLQRISRVLWNGVARLLTLGIVLVGWAFFRSESLADAGRILSRILWWTPDGTRLLSPTIVTSIVGFIGVHLLISKDSNWIEELPERSMPARVAAYSCLLSLVVFLGATDAVPFIYFQF